MIRPLHPMDMPSYLALARRACRQEGVDGGRDDRVSRCLLDFLSRSFTLEAPRQTWVYADGRDLRGVVAVKNRPGSPTWEVDRFLGSDSPDSTRVLESLLEHLSSLGGYEGIQKIFLRLDTTSALFPAARRAGFYPYATERAYRSEVRPETFQPGSVPLRPRRGQDHLALFSHYGRITPARTRQAEALTLQEWRWLDGWQPRRHFRFNLARGRHDYVWWEDGEILASVRIDVRNRLVRATLDPRKAHDEHADAILAFSASRMRPGPTFSLARDYQPLWESVLLRHGFTFVEEYALLVKQLAVRVGEHCLVPVGV